MDYFKKRKKHVQIPRTPENMLLVLRRNGLLDHPIHDFKELLQSGDLIVSDPEADPAVETRELLETLIESGKMAGIDPVILHAMEKTGWIISEENMCLFSEENLKEWNEAIEEGRRIHGHESTRGR